MKKHQTALSFFLLFVIIVLGVHELYPTFYRTLLLDLWEKIKYFALCVFSVVALFWVVKAYFNDVASS